MGQKPDPTYPTVVITPGTGTGEGVTAHPALTGRSTAASHPASAITVAASGFDGNLATSDDTVQKVAQKFDDLAVAAADAADFTAYAIDSATAVDGSATTIAFMNSRTSDAVGSAIPKAFVVGSKVFRPDILDAKIYTVTSSGAWSTFATLDGAQTIFSPIQNLRYVGTNTTDPGGVGTDPNDVATNITPEVPYPAEVAIQPDVTPSFTFIFDLATNSPFSTGSTMAIASHEGYTFVNGDCFIVDGDTSDPLVGYWRLPTAGIGQTAVKLTDGDNVQGVLYEDFSQHNHLLKIAEGYRGQRLAMAYRDEDGVSAREMHWLSGVNVRPYDAVEIAAHDGTTVVQGGGIEFTRFHQKSQPDIVWMRVTPIHSGDTPTVGIGSNAGSGASVVSDQQTDSWGTIAAIAGSGGTAGEFLVVTFADRFLYPSVQLTPRNFDTAAIGCYVEHTLDGSEATGFTVHILDVPIEDAQYEWDYTVTGGSV